MLRCLIDKTKTYYYMIDGKGHGYSLATIDSRSCCEMTSVYHGTDCLG